MLDQGYGIMPNSVLFNNELSDKEKLLYCLISSLCAKEGYSWATNQYLGEKLGLHKDNIGKYLSKMNKSGVIFLQEINNTRYISICKIDENAWGGRGIHLGGVDENTYPIYRMNSIIEKDNVIEESETSQIKEKTSAKKSKSKLSSSIGKVSEPIRAIYVPPTKLMVEERLGTKRGVDKFYEILTLEKMKDPLSLDKICEVYDWTIQFFQEKYDGKIYKDSDTGKMIGAEIIFNEFDKFISHYSEKGDDILCLKARLRKWITNSLKYAV
ncbi:helix-turn-helix domain-containing protein [Candidatus Gracilibacteria bacterium]|nr:helix-turn-helix domain-containing protein [Candidatus Gracilibacteria bacterium]